MTLIHFFKNIFIFDESQIDILRGPQKRGKKTDFISRPFFTIAANMYGMLG